MDKEFYKLKKDLEIVNANVLVPEGTYVSIHAEGALVVIETYPFYPKRGHGYQITVKKEIFTKDKDAFKRIIH